MDTYNSIDPYGTYETKGLSPYEMLMKMSSWNNEIRSTISVMKEDMGSMETQIIQNAEEISLRVTYEDFTGETITSLIVQDAFSINLLAQNLNLVGLVTVSDLAGTGTTIIHGSNILTGTIQANRLNVGTLSAISTNIGYIEAGYISGVIIEGGYIQSNTTINVSQGIQVGNYINIGELHSQSTKFINFNDSAFISGGRDSIGSLITIDAGDGIFLSTGHLWVGSYLSVVSRFSGRGTINFSDVNVTGITATAVLG